jgi:hypothetical protein
LSVSVVLLPILFGVAFLFFSYPGINGHRFLWSWPGALLGLVILLVAAGGVKSFLLAPRVCLDRARGMLTAGWFGLRGRWPLRCVAGVQLLDTFQSVTPTGGAWGGPAGPDGHVPFPVVQLNLVLDQPGRPRLHLTTGDPETVRLAAQQLAEFLQVPVFRRGAAGAPGAGPGPPPDAPRFPALVKGGLQLTAPVLEQPHGRCLVLRPSHWATTRQLNVVRKMLWAVVPTGAGLVLVPFWLVHGTRAWDESTAVVGLLSVLLSLAAAAVVLASAIVLTALVLRPRARFDLATGWVTFGWLGIGGRRPLHGITAIQVTPGPPPQANLVCRQSSFDR